VPIVVIYELDRLKRQGNSTTAKLARQAIKWLVATLPIDPNARSKPILTTRPTASIEVYVHEGSSRPEDADGVIVRFVKKPETFDFLGFTHLCGVSMKGRFWLRCITIKKRMRAKLAAVNEQLKRRRHLSIPEQGQWVGSVMRGHLVYFAVPGNTDAVAAFRTQATRHWYKALRRRSQRTRINWGRMNRIANRWLPPARVIHPFPEVRFAART
jgi:hypothetical protein